MSLSQEDREFVERGNVIPWLSLLIFITVITMILSSRVGRNADMLDDLCRAHYPECILEAKL